MSKKKYIKYGGMRFEQNAPAKEINRFVNNLPEEKRRSLHQVVNELDNAGLIDLKNEVTTIDDEMIKWQETNRHKE
ncbi:MAG: hypothetical protein GXW85_05850 [Clostridia bacterium]|nr:hypothetical protein [Clostridia bacterium]